MMNAMSKQRGFSLLEVLIAVVVLAIGLLGLASLQATSLRMNQDALMRSQEAHLAYDMIDRMRANMPAVTAGDYNVPTATLTAACKTTSGCSTAVMADHDYAEWSNALATAMPGGSGMVCIDSTPNDGTDSANAACDNTGTEYVVKLWWDDDRDAATNNVLFFTSFTP